MLLYQRHTTAKFRNIKRKQGQSHLEIESDKTEAFTRWLRLEEACTADTITEFMLKKEFLQSVTTEVGTYSLDKKFGTLTKATIQSDGFETKHNTFHSNRTPQTHKISGATTCTDKKRGAKPSPFGF